MMHILSTQTTAVVKTAVQGIDGADATKINEWYSELGDTYGMLYEKMKEHIM